MPSPARRGSDLRVDAALVATVLIWAVNFSVVKAALDHLEPFAFNDLRLIGASALFLGLARFAPGSSVRRGDWKLLCLLGVVGHTAYQLLFIHGIDETTAGNAAILLGLTPVFVAALGGLFAGERSGGRVWAGILVSIAGVYLVLSDSETRGGSLRGDFLTLGATLCWSVYTVAGQPLVTRYGLLRTNAYTFAIGSFLFVPLGLPTLLAVQPAAVPAAAWLAVGFSFVFALVVAYTLWYYGVSRIGATQTSIYANLTPVAALLVAWAALGESVGALQLSGTGLILAGIYLVRSGRRRARPPSLDPRAEEPIA